MLINIAVCNHLFSSRTAADQVQCSPASASMPKTAPNANSQHEFSYWAGTTQWGLLMRVYFLCTISFVSREAHVKYISEVRERGKLGWRETSAWAEAHLLGVCTWIHSSCSRQRKCVFTQSPRDDHQLSHNKCNTTA